jgi:glycosyltransferase involved in cell wall biosynthesis
MKVALVTADNISLGLQNSVRRIYKYLNRKGVQAQIACTPLPTDVDIFHAFYASRTGYSTVQHAHTYNIPVVLRDDFYFDSLSIPDFQKALLQADAVTVNLPRLKIYAPEKAVVIPNGIDPEIFEDGIAELDLIPPVIATSGYIRPSKNFDTLCRAVAHFQKSFYCTLLVIGDGIGVQETINKHQINNYHITGILEHKYVLQYLRLANVYLTTSHHEGCSNAVLEAMYCGLPVVATECLRDLVDDTCSTDNYRDLADLIEVKLQNQFEGEFNHQKILSCYTANQEADELITLYERCITEKSIPKTAC